MTDNISDMSGKNRSRDEMLADLASLPGGSGGGNSGGMEPRVAKLEASVEHIAADVVAMRSDVANARERLAALEVKVDHLPTKGFIVTVVAAALAVVAGLIGYTQQLQSFFAP
ncbi:hypothetical protein [Pseudophaeobacter sp.]|jgi:hypothetical protein|uniref:hypothetical protein n=1 Tax=Pseudophaeobacter sp. TaxID=1971739 RepID=UPI0032D9A902